MKVLNMDPIKDNIMTKENTIVWQKWVDPFGFDEDYEIDNISNSNHDDREEFSNFIDENNEDIESKQQDLKDYLNYKKAKPHIKVIATPMGIIPFNDNTASNKIFNFWVGHTNFDITGNVASIIEETDGVETLDIFTRYRFRISVGKAFDDSVVMRDINHKVYSELNHVK